VWEPSLKPVANQQLEWKNREQDHWWKFTSTYKAQPLLCEKVTRKYGGWKTDYADCADTPVRISTKWRSDVDHIQRDGDNPDCAYSASYAGTRLFGLAVSVTGHFGRDISVHKELMKFVKFANVNEYLGRITICPYNTRQINNSTICFAKSTFKLGC